MALLFKKQKASRRLRVPADQDKRAYIYRSQRTRSEVRPPREQSKTDQNKSIKRGRVILPLIGIGVFIAVFFGGSLEQTSKIDVDKSTSIRTEGEYKEKADQLLKSSLKNRSKFTIEKNKIEDSMRSSFPEIESISISTPPWLNKPLFKISIFDTQLVFSSLNERYLVNVDGLIISQSKQSEMTLSKDLLIIIDETGQGAEVGKRALSADQVDYIRQINHQLTSKKLSIKEIKLKPGGEEIHVYFNDLKYFAKFNFQADARRSAGAFVALKQKLEKDNIRPKSYIDVRVAERGYIK